jgi:hypothetical protein
MEPLDLFISPSCFPLAFQKKCTISFGFGKYPKSIPKNCVYFLGLGMNLVMKTNSIDKIIYIKMFTASILRAR